ncbi:MAG: NAD(P)H-hydrate epimerase [Chloroflexi bacterium]|nr:NAD(P)H-hydrate epimerase [Chloroflexota bacterium]
MIPLARTTIPAVTAAQMREVDRLMIEAYHIDLIQMMEHAGRNLARVARERFLSGNPLGKRVVVLVGKGGNGGGALVAGRWLANAGADVVAVIAADRDKFAPVPAHQLLILERIGVPILTLDAPELSVPASLIVDGVLGYSLAGAPRGRAADMIRWANAAGSPILALDVPSGLDATTGEVEDPTIHANATLTLALPKSGLLADSARSVVGTLYVANISVPPALYAEPSLGIHIGPVFAQSDVVQLW